MAAKSVDPRVYELAEFFLQSAADQEPGNTSIHTEENVADLAAEIQTTIEDFFFALEGEKEN